MAWTSRDSAQYNARTILKEFDVRKITLPRTVNTAVDEWQRITTAIPAEPAATALHDAVIGGASQADLDAVALAVVASAHVRSAYMQAAQTAAQAVLRSILDAAGPIHEQLAAQAAENISQLERIAAQGNASLADLVRDGDTDAARLHADRELIGTELLNLYNVRDTALFPGGLQAARVGHFDCTRWVDPNAPEHHHRSGTITEGFIGGLQVGGRLWFPTAQLAKEAAAPLFDEWQRGAEHAAATRRNAGGIAAFT